MSATLRPGGGLRTSVAQQGNLNPLPSKDVTADEGQRKHHSQCGECGGSELIQWKLGDLTGATWTRSLALGSSDSSLNFCS